MLQESMPITCYELKQGIEKLNNLKENINKVKAHSASQYNPGWNLAIDISNMIVTCEAVAKSALERNESRGGHTRSDFPDEDTKCLEYNLVVKKNDDDTMSIKKELRQDPPEELSKIAYSTLEELENAQ